MKSDVIAVLMEVFIVLKNLLEICMLLRLNHDETIKHGRKLIPGGKR